MLEQRIADGAFLNLILKWLQAGIGHLTTNLDPAVGLGQRSQGEVALVYGAQIGCGVFRLARVSPFVGLGTARGR